MSKKLQLVGVLNTDFETKTDASAKLEEAKAYTDTVASDKANISHDHADVHYTKTEIDNLELITADDVDTICGTTIEVASADNSEVTF